MLVLSRKKNESIIINDRITLTVIEIRGDKVRLGIEAPKDVPVHRLEVFEAIQAQAAPPTPGPRADTPTDVGSHPITSVEPHPADLTPTPPTEHEVKRSTSS